MKHVCAVLQMIPITGEQTEHRVPGSRPAVRGRNPSQNKAAPRPPRAQRSVLRLSKAISSLRRARAQLASAEAGFLLAGPPATAEKGQDPFPLLPSRPCKSPRVDAGSWGTPLLRRFVVLYRKGEFSVPGFV